MPDQLLREYISRINRVIDFIETDLSRPFTLAELADVAGFSRFHFSRVFQGIMGEAPMQFIQRLRLERSAGMLLIHSSLNISEVGYRCGFSDLSIFSRNFRRHFGMSPSAYRQALPQHGNVGQAESKTGQAESNPGQDNTSSSAYFCYETQTIQWRTKMKLNKSIEVRELPDMTVAYVRHIGPYAGDEQLFRGLWEKLFRWAGPRGLIGGPGFRSLIVYHDDPNVTESARLRTSVCITVPPDTKVEGEVGKMEVAGGRYVIARFEVRSDEFGQAWDWIFSQWFPTSGYQPDDRLSFEMYPEEPRDGKITVDICVPVKPL